MVDTVLVNAIGSVTISGLTLVGAVYLLWTLWKQGKGKLRVRLLVGTVISDILVGLVALPPEAMYIAGAGLETGSRGCNAVGFIFTTVLFTQHMWTLCIAIATFMLLKYPLSNATTAMEKYSWLTWPLIWGTAILHSGIWYAAVGFSSSGNVCYYASTSTVHVDGRDLVQFIPRALVFVIVVILYSRLYSFLRRPDTIQLSTQFMSGSAQDAPAGGLQHKMLKPLARLGRLGSLQIGSARRESAPAHDPAAPWEQLEFVNVGAHVWSTQSVGGGGGILANPLGSLGAAGGRRHTHPATLTTAAAHEHSMHLATRLHASTAGAPPRAQAQAQAQAQSHFSRTSHLASHLSHASHIASRPDVGPLETTPELDAEAEFAGPVPSHLHRPSEPDTLVGLVTPVLPYEARPAAGPGVRDAAAGPGPALSKADSDYDDSDEYEDVELGGDGKRRPSGQTLKEFFQDAEHSFPGNPAPLGAGAAAGGGGGGGAAGKPKIQMSATAYFNRQASLLMLYFPIAYMFVFSVSLVRLIVDMVEHTSPPALSILSAWMVLSVGLIDALVFGLAEFIVRQRVRRKMPDRMG